MANILSVIPYHILPPKSGGQNDIIGFTDFLGKKHKVVVLSTNLNEGENPYSFELLSIFGGTRWRYFNLFHIVRIIRLGRKNKVQYMVTHQPFMVHFVFIASRILRIPFYLHNHNLEFERYRTMGMKWWPLMKAYEGWTMRKAKALFFRTAFDKDLAMKSFNLPAAKCFIVPYGIYYPEVPKAEKNYRDTILKSHSLDEKDKILLFFGMLSYQPNYEAVELIVDKINPLLLEQKGFNYKILICGKGLPERFYDLKEYKDKNIINVGFVNDINEYIRAADVVLNPVVTGGGIKTKVVEALGFDKNVVSTYSGAIGIDENVAGGKMLISADNDWEKFALNTVKATTLELHTPKAFFDIFYWGNIVDGLQPLFE